MVIVERVDQDDEALGLVAALEAITGIVQDQRVEVAAPAR